MTDPMTGSRRLAPIAGLAAATLALGVAQLVGALVGGGYPLTSLGSVTIDATPSWLKEAVISVAGTHDKTVLLTVLGVVVAALAATAGVAEHARRGAGVVTVAVLGVVTVGAVETRAAAGLVQSLPTLVGFTVGAALLSALTNRLRPGWVSRRPQNTGRRAFLAGAGAGVLAGVAAAAVGHLASRAARTATAARSALRLPRPAVAAPPIPAGVQPPVAGLTTYLTPVSDFYRIDTALTFPEIDPQSWRLRIHGMVDHEIHASFADLLAEDLVSERVTLSCVSNDVGGHLAGTALWLGVPTATLLRRAGARAGADMVLSTSADGFTAATPLDALLDPDRGALLAVGMNAKPLPVPHGFPVRLVVPGLYGYVSATKWLTDLRVTRYADATSYWTQRGWAAKAPIKTTSRIDVPSQDAHVSAGTVTVAGVAWAPPRGIEAVQVRVDDGPWRDAVLAADGGADTWRLWTLAWDASPGDHTLTVRATDGRGALQTGTVAPPEPDGATGWHQIQVHVQGGD